MPLCRRESWITALEAPWHVTSEVHQAWKGPGCDTAGYRVRIIGIKSSLLSGPDHVGARQAQGGAPLSNTYFPHAGLLASDCMCQAPCGQPAASLSVSNTSQQPPCGPAMRLLPSLHNDGVYIGTAEGGAQLPNVLMEEGGLGNCLGHSRRHSPSLPHPFLFHLFPRPPAHTPFPWLGELILKPFGHADAYLAKKCCSSTKPRALVQQVNGNQDPPKNMPVQPTFTLAQR